MLNSEFIRDHRSHLHPVRLDESNLIILRELYSDARTPNNILAERANLAPSTCLNRVETIT